MKIVDIVHVWIITNDDDDTDDEMILLLYEHRWIKCETSHIYNCLSLQWNKGFISALRMHWTNEKRVIKEFSNASRFY